MPLTVLRDVEDEVNQVLIDDLEVRAFVTPIDEARSMGAIALFGEKYGDEVRVVEVGTYSRELCGGTHVAHSGQLGLIKILGESSIGSGVRRVEALVGTDAFRYLARENVLVSQLTEQLKTRREDLPDRVASLVSRLREAERDLDRLRSAQILGSAAELAGQAEDAGPVALVVHQVPDGTTADDIRKLALDIRGRLPQQRPAVVVIAGRPGRPARGRGRGQRGRPEPRRRRRGAGPQRRPGAGRGRRRPRRHRPGWRRAAGRPGRPGDRRGI